MLIVLCCALCKTEISVATDSVFKNSTDTVVQYRTSLTGPWLTTASTHTLLIDRIPDLNKVPVTENSWGGKAGDYSSKAKNGTAGFFRIGKVGSRWVFIDPDNGMNIIHGVQGVDTQVKMDTPNPEFFTVYSNNLTNWSLETANLIADNSFNCISTSMVSDIKKNLLNPTLLKKMSYTDILYMVQDLGWDPLQRPSWFRTNIDNPLCLMWEPVFLTFIDSIAKTKAALYKDDIYFLGYLLDNELGFYSTNSTPGVYGIDIKAFMAFPKTTSAYIYANNFLIQRGVSILTLNQADKDAFRDSVTNYFYRVTTAAIRKYDPNHLILGSRINPGIHDKITLRACAKYCDVVSINLYGCWDPDLVNINDLRLWTNDKPFMVTEFYTKGDDACYNGIKQDNKDGGGWFVGNQSDRGCFYQNYCIKLLKTLNCVGWLHFKYGDALIDNSPNLTNKGIVSPTFTPYLDFLKYIKQLNTNVYNITNYIDGVPTTGITTAVENKKSNITVLVRGANQIKVGNVDGLVSLYDSLGKLVAKKIAVNSSVDFIVNANGVYIISNGEDRLKIIF